MSFPSFKSTRPVGDYPTGMQIFNVDGTIERVLGAEAGESSVTTVFVHRWRPAPDEFARMMRQAVCK